MEDTTQTNYKTLIDGDNLVLEISGILDVTSTPSIWEETNTFIQGSNFKKIIVQASGIHDCEGVGIALLFHYKKIEKNLNII